jgi:hypothetical protein
MTGVRLDGQKLSREILSRSRLHYVTLSLGPSHSLSQAIDMWPGYAPRSNHGAKELGIGSFVVLGRGILSKFLRK